jgi:hypothetical protein
VPLLTINSSLRAFRSARATSPSGRCAQAGSTLGLAPAIVPAGRGARPESLRRELPARLANNERPPSKPHSPVNHAVHAGGCRRHHRLGHRRRTHRSPVPSASARITEMTSGSRRGLRAACLLPSGLYRGDPRGARLQPIHSMIMWLNRWTFCLPPPAP